MNIVKCRRQHITNRVGSLILSGLGTDISKLASKLVIEDRHNDYLELKVNPSDYEDWNIFQRDYCAVELLSKSETLNCGIDRVAVALEKFLASEDACKHANLRIRNLDSAGIETPDGLLQVLTSARVKIERLLGRFDWDEASKWFGFGPGATFNTRRSHGDAWYKFGHLSPTTTQGNLGLSVACILHTPRWETILTENSGRDVRDCFTIVPGNKIITVPKNAKTDRVIAVEPLMNMYIQKGIGSMIRHRLKRVGVNLDDQSLNQLLAYRGSISGKLATIDLSSASDTVCLELVRWLLPPDWVEALEQCRSPRGVLPNGEIITYQKVSSMGNGFTFELESLIFWSIIRSLRSLKPLSASDRVTAVYGDDLIVPVETVDELRQVLGYIGFTFNASKSFWHGPFRESCGKHYFRGRDVTPFYIRKDKMVGPLENQFILANGITRLAHRLTGGVYRDSDLLPAHRLVVETIPSRYKRFFIPDGVGDGALLGELDEALPRRPRHHVEGWVYRHVVQVNSSGQYNGYPMLLKGLSVLEQCYTTEVASSEKLLKTRRLKIIKSVVKQWSYLGPWS